MTTFDQWRDAARPLLVAGVSPVEVEWQEPQALATGRPAGALSTKSAIVAASAATAHGTPLRIPRPLLESLKFVSMFRHEGRWELMYRLAWRTFYERAGLYEDAADADVRNALVMVKAVRRDVHKMHAYVRFREVRAEAGTGADTAYIAWFEPQHDILRHAATFFVKRFANMSWTIATPDGAASWSEGTLCIVEPRAKLDVAGADRMEDLWRIYYRSICNVARLNPAAMQREMPQRYWRYLPEAREIAPLLREGLAQLAQRSQRKSEDSAMAHAGKRALPAPSCVEAPATCRRCDLWQNATQAVTGTGPATATMVLVGEQPGDEEDLRGRPFVGPAGKVLDLALARAGVQRSDVFITNAVKHFKWEPRGKRRLHKKPGAGEIDACKIWLSQELATLQAVVIVALGASALRALTGAQISIESARQQELTHTSGARIIATYHPSAILRAHENAEALRSLLEDDLRSAGRLAASAASAALCGPLPSVASAQDVVHQPKPRR